MLIKLEIKCAKPSLELIINVTQGRNGYLKFAICAHLLANVKSNADHTRIE